MPQPTPQRCRGRQADHGQRSPLFRLLRLNRATALRGYCSGDAASDKLLGHGERVPAGTLYLRLLDLTYISLNQHEREAEIEMGMHRLVLRRPRRNPTVFDIHRALRHCKNPAGINPGFFHQLSHRRFDQPGIIRLEMAPGLQNNSVRDVVNKQNFSTAADQERTNGNVHSIVSSRGKSRSVSQ